MISRMQAELAVKTGVCMIVKTPDTIQVISPTGCVWGVLPPADLHNMLVCGVIYPMYQSTPQGGNFIVYKGVR